MGHKIRQWPEKESIEFFDYEFVILLFGTENYSMNKVHALVFTLS